MDTRVEAAARAICSDLFPGMNYRGPGKTLIEVAQAALSAADAVEPEQPDTSAFVKRLRRLAAPGCDGWGGLPICDEAADEIERLGARLPEGMKDCIILFRECPRGHGRLTASNWIEHGCVICKCQEAEAEVERLREALSRCGDIARAALDNTGDGE